MRTRLRILLITGCLSALSACAADTTQKVKPAPTQPAVTMTPIPNHLPKGFHPISIRPDPQAQSQPQIIYGNQNWDGGTDTAGPTVSTR